MLKAAADILKVPSSQPWRLFGAVDQATLRGAFHDLARVWHPDFRHITLSKPDFVAVLRGKARTEKLVSWAGPTRLGRASSRLLRTIFGNLWPRLTL